MNRDLEHAIAVMRADREALLRAVRPLTAADMRVARRGGWGIGRVLEHVVQSEVAYAKLLAHLCGRPAPDLRFDDIDDGATAEAQLAETRAAVHAAIDGVQDATLYLLASVGHEEYSPLSVLENIALHDREHEAQVQALLGYARGSAAPRPAAADVAIRPAIPDDLPRLVEIYNHYVVNTPTTFDLEPFSLDDRREWFSHYAETGRHRLLVAEDAAGVAGYASTSRFHPRAAYDTTVEMTVICAPETIGRGIGQKLYEAMFDAIAGEDVHSAVALITLPNDASCALHERFGFTPMGVMRDAGRKFDRYWDVAFYQRVFESHQ